MSSPLRIRPARDEELDIVASLIVDAYAEYAARMSPDAWSMFAHDIANVHGRMVNGEIVVAESDDRLVGTVTLFSQWRGAQEDSAGLRLLAVPPAHRGNGVGSALLQYCIERAREAGKQRVVMTVAQEMDTFRDLTERMGARREPGLDHEPAPGVRLEGYAIDL